MEKIILNEIELTDISINTIKELQNNNNKKLKENIEFIQSVKDLLADLIINDNSNHDKIVGYAKMNGKLIELSDTLKNLKK